MTFSSTLTLAIAMVILAATPGPGILLVSSQTLKHNLRAGFLTTLGIMVADMFFILLVTYGLAALVKNLQSLIVFINFIGGLYLIFLGTISFRNSFKNEFDSGSSNTSFSNSENSSNGNTSLKNSLQFLASGFFVTLSNPKAIIFYLSFLPAFVDLTSLKHTDVLIIMLTAIVTIMPTMMIYAWMSHQASKVSKQQHSQLMPRLAALMIFIVGCYMLYRSTL